MDNTKQQLDALRPQIDRILRISGSPGLSLGVLHRGEIIHTAHFGSRNAQDSAQSNDDTIHTVASLTKPITAAAIAKLVYEKKLDWDVPIREYLPAIRIRRDELGTKASLRDLLSLRTGIAPANTLWGFQNNEVLMNRNENASTATYIGVAKPFGQFVYSQWNYSLVDDVVKEVTGASIGEYIEQNIFRPLKMTRSSFSQLPESEGNIAHTHCTHDDGTASRKPDATSAVNESSNGAGGGARSSLRDYLILLQALLYAHKNQLDNNVDSTLGLIFPHTRAMFTAQLALSVLLGEAPAVDFVKMAELARDITFQNYKLLEKEVAKGKTDVLPTKSLTAYKGDYYNAILNFVLSITVAGDGLSVRIQRGNSGFALSPYDGDTFYWPVNREEEMCVKDMFGFMYKDWHLFHFETNSNGEVDKLSWRHDPYLARPEVFTKVPTKQVFARL